MRLWLGPLLLCGLACFAQTQNIEALYAQLNEPATTNSAAQQIHDLASKDATARNFLAQNLPAMITAGVTGGEKSLTFRWANAVRLAGQLKLDTTVRALIQALPFAPIRAGYDKQDDIGRTFGRGATLEFDIVARALADIGDPAVPAVANVLANGDTRVLRLRAAWILKNIDTTAAHKAMIDRAQVETEPAIKSVLEGAIK
jgi:hypothetical protein